MSRNNKNATRMEQKRAMSKMRVAGNKGAASTNAVHGKRFTYRNNPEIQKRLADMKGGGSDNRNSRGRTSGKKILETAGGAARQPEQKAA